jgi:serine/threonine protein kinase/tetratricopeptide (TPR) repeat protein
MTPHEAGESLAAQMAADWAQGERLPAEHYLEQNPELLDQPEEAVRLIYEEVCQRQERGEEVTAEELGRRFPRWADELAVMLDCHRLVECRLAPPVYPAVGETLGDFTLLAELGRGTHGRVFLATQPALADRPVVLKVTPRQDGEFLCLARLQHTHIIPLYGVHDFPARNLRALCQPYLGGATLAKVLDLLQAVPLAQRTGQSLVDALARTSEGLPLPGPARGPRTILGRLAYAEAIAWIGACLADGLHYAHERGLVHLDLKPSNVLLEADGQPLLLDFHLSRHPVLVGQVVDEGIGGTRQYMSPEQAAAYTAACQRLPVPVTVDGRSDVYSLGRLLYAALGRQPTDTGLDLPPLPRCNPRVSPGLADVIHRCLAANPADRYGSAADLAADLRRHLADLPLRGVPNRSLAERWRKWRRRRPMAPRWVSLVLALLGTGLILGAGALERLQDARDALREGRAQIQRQAYADAQGTLDRGRGRVAALPGCRALVREIDAELDEARRAAAAQQLHALAERLRLLVGGESLHAQELRTLDAHCRAIWEVRTLLADRATGLVQAEQARADLIDLALLWSDVKHRLAPDNQAARAEATTLRDEAEALCGTHSPWQHVILGRTLLARGELDRAAAELEKAVEVRPQDFWAHYYSGLCAYRRGRSAQAINALTVAIALAPQFAPAYHNRALAHAACGQTVAAMRDYDRALELAPELAAAALNRGILHYQQGRFAAARADLERALQRGADPAVTWYNLALMDLARGDRPAARASAVRALDHDSTHTGARRLLDQLGSIK